MTITNARTESVERGLRVSDRVEIREVALIVAKLAQRVVNGGAELAVEVHRRSRANADVPNSLLSVHVEFEFIAREANATESPIPIEIQATYRLTYSVSKMAELTQQDYDDFAEVNGVFNAWPYFREFLQSSLLRMGLPPFTLPVFRVAAPPVIK